MTEPNYKAELNNIFSKLKDFLNNLANVENDAVKQKIKFERDSLNRIINRIKKIREGKKKATETIYNDIIDDYNINVKDNLETTINNEPAGLIKNKLDLLKGLLPPIKNEFKAISSDSDSEPIENEQPEQPKIKISPNLTKGALPKRVAKQNPEEEEAEPEQPYSEEEQQGQPEQEEQQGQPEPEQQPEQEKEPEEEGNNNQMVPKEDFKIAKQEIEDFKNNPQLDIVKGVGEVIEFIATSTLTDEMIEELIDELLGLKDSHGNLLFSNRFQIEDLIRNRKKRKRLKYLLPKRIINAEKPDEQKLILNPMLRRGRIASMTSAKTRYYNYI